MTETLPLIGQQFNTTRGFSGKAGGTVAWRGVRFDKWRITWALSASSLVIVKGDWCRGEDRADGFDILRHSATHVLYSTGVKASY
ncbi:hypothetical protein N7475_005653 [Penicillium sp. IBT 31633x]|nr:hypothetical protein N7475_005653 [Penicillium sp. IBT 31633x]